MGIKGEFEYAGGKSRLRLSDSVLVTDAARQAGLVLNTSCAGRGVCGGCTVELLAGTYRHDGRVVAVPQGQRLRVLGCQTQIVEGPFRIFVPRRSLVETGEQVVSDFVLKNHYTHNPTVRTCQITVPQAALEDRKGDFERLARTIDKEYDIQLSGATLSALRALPRTTNSDTGELTVRLSWRHDDGWELLAAEPTRPDARTYGIAIDIGTTTVAVSLVDVDADKLLDTVTCYNQQIQKADDVAARIVYAGNDEGLEKLRRLIVEETLNPMIALLCRKHQLRHEDLLRAVVSGNTVMWHLFLGVDPTPLGVMPFPPACRYPGSYRARQVGLEIYPEAMVDIMPSISAYVGGDIVGDIYVCRLDSHEDGPQLMIDVGTNGEIALRTKEHMLVTACAAGPAFEGLRIAAGMRASVGAIERISLDASTWECQYEVIGKGQPVGICGSGLIDFLAEAARTGLVNHAGKFDRDLMGRCPRLRRVENSNIMEYAIAYCDATDDRVQDLTITEKDIETLLQAKAAVFAAINILLRRSGTKIGDLERIYLAGGFAKYIDIEKAIMVGLLPEIDLSKYRVVGNGSLAGAFMGLIDRSCWQRFREILDMPRVIELNLDPEFQDEFTSALFLPNLETNLFPNTIKKLREAAKNVRV